MQELSYAASDLILYVENDWESYQKYERIKARLQRFAAAGTYDIERAQTAWFHLMTDAARGYKAEGLRAPSAKERHEAAEAFEAQERSDILLEIRDTTE